MFRNVEKKESNVALKYLSPMSKKFVKSVTLVNFVSQKPICYKSVLNQNRILNEIILVFNIYKRQFLVINTILFQWTFSGDKIDHHINQILDHFFGFHH